MRPNLATFVQDFQRYGKQTAIVTYPGNRRIATSYADLALLSGRFSRLLSERNIHPGERVLLWGANSAEWEAAFFGCVLRGVLAVPLDAGGSTGFATRVIAEIAPRLIVGDAPRLAGFPQSIPTLQFRDFSSALPKAPLLEPESSLARETPLQILFTSGTTSAPKGIVHTHGNVLASVEVLEREIQKYRRYERWVHPLRVLHTLPLSHVFGQFMGLWIAPLLAAPVHYEDKLIAPQLIERIHKERISVAVVVPRVLELLRAHLLVAHPKLSRRLEKISRQKIWWRWWHLCDIHRRFGFKFWAFVSGGATLPPDLEQFWNTLGFVLVQGYGMTETTALATLNHPLRTSRGTIGKPLAGREVRVSEDGEILVRGAMLAAGNWRNGQIEARDEEWLHTGDLGSVDPSGEVRFLGRKSDVIVAASGMNIHPADLEAAVKAQPRVRDAVVVGWNGPRGPEPVAVVLMDHTGSADEEKKWLRQILTGANAHLQEFQQIRDVLRWPFVEFPRNSAGKMLRREVAAWMNQQLKASSASSTLKGSADPLLRLLEQVTGERAAGLDDPSELATAAHLDSLGRMQLAAGMEERFGIAINDEEIAAAKTIGDLRKLLRPENAAAIHQIPTVGQSGKDSSSHIASNPDLPPTISSSQRSALAPRYVHWPWAKPVQLVRVVFLECIARPLVWVLAHPRVICRADLPSEPSIYICNHITVIDGALVLFALPGRVRRHMAIAMSAELLAAWRGSQKAEGLELGPMRFLGPIVWFLVTALFNVFPLPPGAGLRQSFAHAGEALDHGYNILVFPEGRRTRTGELQPFQTGIGVLAEESNTAVVPMAMTGLWEASQRRGIRSWLRPGGLAVIVGDPIRRSSGVSHAAFAESLHTIVTSLISTGRELKPF